MRRFPFPSLPEAGHSLPCPPEYLHHLVSVLRLKEGSSIEASSCGEVALLEAVSVHGEGIVFRVVSKAEGGEVPLQASALLAEIKAMDEAIALLAEQGVAHIYPFFAERSVTKFDPKDAAKKQARRQKLADEAVKKVGGLYGSTVYPGKPFKALGSWEGFPNKILFHEGQGGAANLSAFNFTLPSIFTIGPEGGFTPAETKALLEEGFISASLGTRILRASTACSAAATLIRFHTEMGQ